MAEYYPLLAKAVGSLPNSTPDKRRIVYERARKALIGQLRTYHPPVPEEDIERESIELDRAIERLETEIAAAPPEPAPAPAPPAPASSPSPSPADIPAAAAAPAPRPTPPVRPSIARPAVRPTPTGALGPAVPRAPIAPLRPRAPKPTSAELKPAEPKPAEPGSLEAGPPESPPAPPATRLAATPALATDPSEPIDVPPASPPSPTRLEPPEPAPRESGADAAGNPAPKPRLEGQRPVAPQPPVATGPKRKLWIIPAGIAAVVALVAIAAWKLRVTPESIARATPPAVQTQDNGKLADRVGGAKPSEDQPETTAGSESSAAPQPQTAPAQPAPEPSQQATTEPAAPAQEPAATPQPATPSGNPEVPVAYRAALLVEAPDLPSKVQTFAGTVVWKLNNVNAGPSDAVGLSVEADIDLPDDKMKATVIFEKNSDPSLPASHTIKVRFQIAPGSFSGDIKQINVPQLRGAGNTDGEPLAGVTVPVIANSFLVGLSPGNAEAANLHLIGDQPWVDIPMLLTSGKIAKLTFEKGAAGQRDINEALAYWQKQ